MIKLSVVIITKNEEKNIARCLESVLIAMEPFKKKEIVLVDSASIDKTVELARKFPIKIIQLDSSSFVSPAAGRFVGFLHTEGDYIFFIDGDMSLDESWLTNAIQILESDSKITGIAGKCKDFFFDSNYKLIGEREDRFEVRGGPKRVNNLGGSALYRRSVLNQVGAFNPYLPNKEELELGFRISEAGFKLLRVPYPMTNHYTQYDIVNASYKQAIKQIKRNMHSKRFVGSGQVLRLLLHNKLLKEYIKIHERTILFMILNAIGLISLILSLITHMIDFFGIWLIFMSVIFLVRSVIKRSVKDSIIFTIDLSCGSYGLVKGFIGPPNDPSTYSPTIRIIDNLIEEK